MDDDRTAIDARIHAILDWIREAAAPAQEAAGELHARLAEASDGGKAFRGRLVLAATEGFGGDRATAIDVAAALELFQTAALIHDDVLDGSDTRRGRPATHRAFEADHRARSGLGDPEGYGRAGAILAGDLALIGAMHAAATAGARSGPRVAPLFAEMAVLVTAGQHLDMRESTVEPDPARLADAAAAVMRSKTASYTAEMPLALAAAIAGADDDVIQGARDAGIPLGVAFQLRDDVLGVLGSPDVTGKPVGDDLREGKRTLLVAHVLEHGTPAERSAVTHVLGRSDAGGSEIALAVAALRSSGAVDAVERRIVAEAAQAREAITNLLPRPEAVLALVDSAIDRAS